MTNSTYAGWVTEKRETWWAYLTEPERELLITTAEAGRRVTPEVAELLTGRRGSPDGTITTSAWETTDDPEEDASRAEQAPTRMEMSSGCRDFLMSKAIERAQ